MPQRPTILGILGILAIVLLTAIAYVPTFKAGYIWDDDMHVTKNAALQSDQGFFDMWTWAPRALLNPSAKILPATQQYYPMTFTTFWLEHHAWGDAPLGYHLDNLLLHIAASLLLWLLLRNLGFKNGTAFLAAALFALHPINVESVAWISERKNTLSLLLMLASSICWIKWSNLAVNPLPQNPPRRSNQWLLWSTILFTLALLAKTVAATLPAILLILVWYKRGTITKRAILGTLPLFLIAALLGYQTAWVESHYIGAAGPDFALSLTQRSLIASHALLFYLQKILAPVNLLFVYPRWQINPADLLQWIFPSIIIAALTVLFALRKIISNGPLAAALIFIIALSPALCFINFYPMRFSFVADHFQYVAAIAIFATAAALLATLAHRLEMPAKVSRPVVITLLLTLTLLTFEHARTFKDEITLYRTTLAANPDAWMASENLANVLLAANGEKSFDEAADLYRRVLAQRPADSRAAASLSTVLLGQHKFAEQQAVLEKALSFDSQDPTLHTYLGNALLLQNKFDAALKHFDIAAVHSPDDPENFFSWGNTLLSADRPAEAEEKFRKALSLPVAENDKQAQARYRFYLGLSLRDQNRLASAAEAFVKALNLDPTMHDALFELANLHVRLHNDKRAHDALLLALKIAPKDLKSNVALARLVRTTADPAVANPLEAIEHLQRAVEITHEEEVGYLIELADALSAAKFPDEAADAIDKAVNIARKKGLPPDQMELLLTRAQEYHIDKAPPIHTSPSPLTVANGIFDPKEPEPPEEPAPPIKVEPRLPP